VNVLRRSGKEVERLLSMFDKCTVYTIYNRDDFCQISTPPNEFNGKNDICCLKQISSSLNTNPAPLLTTTNYHLLQQINHQQLPQISCSFSPSSSSIDGGSSCSISPKHLQQESNTKKGTLTKHFQFFRLTSRSCSNTLK
jgi:hypothetical protein